MVAVALIAATCSPNGGTVISNFRCPVDGSQYSDDYGPRGSGFHYGIDMRAPTGTPIWAVKSGSVHYTVESAGGLVAYLSANDGNVNGFYDNVAMYNDTPAARKLMQYLATAQAQQIWADDGGTLGAIKTLTYKDPIFKRAAEVANTAKNLLVTAGDFMPSDMQAAFWKSLLDVTKNPGSLDSVLSHLDQVQAAAYKAS